MQENEGRHKILSVDPEARVFSTLDKYIETLAERRGNAHTDCAFLSVAEQAGWIDIAGFRHPWLVLGSHVLHAYVSR